MGGEGGVRATAKCVCCFGFFKIQFFCNFEAYVSFYWGWPFLLGVGVVFVRLKS